MVHQSQLWLRIGLEVLIFKRLSLFALLLATPLYAAELQTGVDYLKEASTLYSNGNYFKAARYAFAALERDGSLKPGAYAWVTMSLSHAGLPHLATYFFIRSLESRDSAAIHSVLTQTQALMLRVGPDILRKYLVRYTRYENYDSNNRDAYIYSLGKDALLSGDHSRAIGYLEKIQSDSPFKPFALQLTGTSLAILDRSEEALNDFKACQESAGGLLSSAGSDIRSDIRNVRHVQRESDDLRSRCIAGQARTLYQMGKFEEADRVYDSIPKASFVWPDILFEQAWNSFAREEYNRTLGKLVTYKSPALSFMFNPEIEVLRAQSFLALCLYSDANETINDFNKKYTKLGIEVKEFVEKNADNLPLFYDLGRNALRNSFYTQRPFYQLLNRFIRGPYFQSLVDNEQELASELEAVRKFDLRQSGVGHDLSVGFPGFLQQVIDWRLKSIQILGGAFIKNSLIDHHAVLIDEYEKMAFIKLEMLKRSKDKLIYKKSAVTERALGTVQPERRDDQYRWSFNGEFWNDELGDYVFGLESECSG